MSDKTLPTMIDLQARVKVLEAKALVQELKNTPIWSPEEQKLKQEVRELLRHKGQLLARVAELELQLREARDMTAAKDCEINRLQACLNGANEVWERYRQKQDEYVRAVDSLRKMNQELKQEIATLRSGRLGDPLIQSTVGPLRQEIEKLRELVGFHEADAKHERMHRDEAERAVIQMREIITMTNTDKLNERIAFLERARKAARVHLDRLTREISKDYLDAARLWLLSAEANA